MSEQLVDTREVIIVRPSRRIVMTYDDLEATSAGQKVDILESEALIGAYMRERAREEREAARLQLSELGRWALLEGGRPE